MHSVRGLATVIAAAVALAACSGGSDGADTSDVEPTGDDDATLEFVEAELVWALDGEPIGDELSYGEPIDRDRFEAGLRWEVRFAATGDVGDLETELFRRISVNDDLIEGGPSSVGPERGRFYVDDVFEFVADGDLVTASLHVDRPVSAASLADQRRRFEALTGLDADAEQVDLGDGLVLNADQLIDLPPAAAGSVNRYEYRARGEVTIGNGTSLEIDEPIQLRVIDPPTPPELDLGDSCNGLAEQYLDQVAVQFDQPELVLLDRVFAADAISRAAIDADCAPTEFSLVVCSAGTALVDSVGGDESAAPWSDAVAVCPSGQAFVEATVLDAALTENTMQLTVPATRDGLPPLRVAMSIPTWELSSSSARTNGQEVELEWPGADDFREAWIEVATSTMPASLLDERFSAATRDDDLAGVEAAREVGDHDGRPWEWVVYELGTIYEFAAAHQLDDERLLTVRGNVTTDDGRSPTTENVVELISCMTSSIAVTEWDFGLEPSAAGGDCSTTGTFAPDAADDESADAESTAEPGEESAAEPGEESAADETADETSDADADETEESAAEPVDAPGDGSDEAGSDEPEEAPAATDFDPTPTVIDGDVLLPIPATETQDERIAALVGPDWDPTLIEADGTRTVVEFAGPESGATFQVALAFASNPSNTVDRLLEPIGSDATILDARDVDLVDGDGTVVVSSWEPLSGSTRIQATAAVAVTDSHVLSIRVIAPIDGSLDAAAILDDALATLVVL